MARPPRGLNPNRRGFFDQDQYEGPASESDLPTGRSTFGRGGVGALFGSGQDFEIYVVEDADQYYLGPSKSTRVRAHMFVPNVDITDPNMSSQFDAFTLTGLIYVMFQNNGNIYVYGTNSPFTLHEYRMFRESPSKGKAVRQMESRGYREAMGSAPSEFGSVQVVR